MLRKRMIFAAVILALPTYALAQVQSGAAQSGVQSGAPQSGVKVVCRQAGCRAA
jgi:hypothetical protein